MMDAKSRILIALSAATAANCIPCFQLYYEKAKAAAIDAQDISEAAEIGQQMKTGAQIAMRNAVSEIAAGKETADMIDSDLKPMKPRCCS